MVYLKFVRKNLNKFINEDASYIKLFQNQFIRFKI